MGLGPKRIAHWEHWSNPDAETFLAGIDYYAHPRSCRLRLKELYPQLGHPIPPTDDPKPRPEEQEDKGKGRWGDAYRDYWQQEEASRRFRTQEEVLGFSPLEQGDFTGWNVVEDGDFRSEDIVYQRYRRLYPAEWGDNAPAESSASPFFYNTMFMWPMLVFGYQNCFIAGEGDNRILMRNDTGEIRSMVESMVETGRMSGGYMICIGNHIPYNVSPEGVKTYLDLSAELAYR